MGIKISDAPRLTENPEFGALVVLIPLNEGPTDAWLQHLRVQKLPGTAHRVVEEGIVFRLDRNDMNVAGAMREIAEAIEKANDASDKASEEDEKRAYQRASEMASKRERLDRKLAEWWAEQEGSSDAALTTG